MFRVLWLVARWAACLIFCALVVLLVPSSAWSAGEVPGSLDRSALSSGVSMRSLAEGPEDPTPTVTETVTEPAEPVTETVTETATETVTETATETVTETVTETADPVTGSALCPPDDPCTTSLDNDTQAWMLLGAAVAVLCLCAITVTLWGGVGSD